MSLNVKVVINSIYKVNEPGQVQAAMSSPGQILF